MSVPCLMVKEDELTSRVTLLNMFHHPDIATDFWNLHVTNPAHRLHLIVLGLATNTSAWIHLGLTSKSNPSWSRYLTTLTIQPSIVNSAPRSVSGFVPKTAGLVVLIRCIFAAPRITCTGSLSSVAASSLKCSLLIWWLLFFNSEVLGLGRWVRILLFCVHAL